MSQQSFLSDEGVEDAVYDSYAFRKLRSTSCASS